MVHLIEGPVIVHGCPPGDAAFTPCCGRNPHDLPRDHRITLDPALVTCELTPAQRVAYRNRGAVDAATRLAPGPTHQAPTEPPAAAALAAFQRLQTLPRAADPALPDDTWDPDDSDAEMADYVAGLRRSGTVTRYVPATDRDHLAALVDHYERHLTAIGRQWVIAEAHRRADTALTAHPDSEETAP